MKFEKLEVHRSQPPKVGTEGVTVRSGVFSQNRLGVGERFILEYLPEGIFTNNEVLHMHTGHLCGVPREWLPLEIEPGARTLDGLLIAMNNAFRGFDSLHPVTEHSGVVAIRFRRLS
jgi:hypothetical protein